MVDRLRRELGELEKVCAVRRLADHVVPGFAVPGVASVDSVKFVVFVGGHFAVEQLGVGIDAGAVLVGGPPGWSSLVAWLAWWSSWRASRTTLSSPRAPLSARRHGKPRSLCRSARGRRRRRLPQGVLVGQAT